MQKKILDVWNRTEKYALGFIDFLLFYTTRTTIPVPFWFVCSHALLLFEAIADLHTNSQTQLWNLLKTLAQSEHNTNTSPPLTFLYLFPGRMC